MEMHYFDLQQRLFSASAAGDLAELREVLDSGVDINCRDHCGMTPFLTAVLHDRAKAARFLLHNGAELREILDEDGSELHIMVWIEYMPRVKRLARIPWMLEARDSQGRTPLLLAAQRRNERIVKLLIEQEAPLSLADHDGNTALSAAAASGELRIVELLLRHGAEVEGSPYHEFTPLQLAGDPDVRALLRQYGAQTHACWQKVG